MWWTRRRVRFAGLAATIAVATFLLMVLLPLPQHFVLDGAAIYDLQETCPGIDTTAGTTVNFHWTAASPVYFFVVSCSANQETYSGNGTQGSGSFVSIGGVYEFGASCFGPYPCVRADVAGTYTGPLLAL
jgi:hypothetical protein